MTKTFHVYILTGKSGVLYTGVTNNLTHRIQQHKKKQFPGFTQQYNLTRLVWFEAQGSAATAIRREKQIKSWTRAKRVALIEAMNPKWTDLSETLR